LIFTGQHAALDPEDYGLREYPAINLGCAGRADPHNHAAVVEAAMLDTFRDPPDLVIVQGDTSSALGGARAAATAGVPLAHVEAGLRTGDPALPWPEEDYRVEIDAIADLLFAPTNLSAFNLACERTPGQVHVTGNTSIDALLAVIADFPPPNLRESTLPSVLVTCHRRESWGEGIASVAAAVSELAHAGIAACEVIVPPNAHVAKTLNAALANLPNVTLNSPCPHRELLQRMRDSDLVLSDSGGMQEEAPVLGVPLLILREKTERPEGIDTGNMRLVGTDRTRIVAEVRQLLSDPLAYSAMSRKALPYGDGHAAPRIAEIIVQWLAGREMVTPTGLEPVFSP
jgi:UDP-N-acetylglucosamine 2-epimerase (non-hydrolysing)